MATTPEIHWILALQDPDEFEKVSLELPANLITATEINLFLVRLKIELQAKNWRLCLLIARVFDKDQLDLSRFATEVADNLRSALLEITMDTLEEVQTILGRVWSPIVLLLFKNRDNHDATTNFLVRMVLANGSPSHIVMWLIPKVFVALTLATPPSRRVVDNFVNQVCNLSDDEGTNVHDALSRIHHRAFSQID